MRPDRLTGRHLPLLSTLLLSCIALSSFCVGCNRGRAARDDVSIQMQVTPQPVRTRPEMISVRIVDKAGMPVSHARVGIEADMTHPGMAPLFGNVRELGQGRYEGPIEFNMGGDWVVMVQVKAADGRRFERQFLLKDVQPN